VFKFGATALALCFLPCFAAELTVGAIFLGFDNPIFGQNSLAVYNATGPTFGCDASSGLLACNDLSFLNSSVLLEYEEGGVAKSLVVDLDEVTPGFLDFSSIPGLRFPGDWLISRIAFSGQLGSAQVVLGDGSVRTVRRAVSGAIVLPNPNVPESQQALLTVEEVQNVIPEPSSLSLIAVALGAATVVARRRR
jgi:hypothetical protein